MYLNMKNFIIYSVVMTMVTSMIMAQQESQNSITLDTMPKAVKGFPFILKVTISGRQEVPSLSIIDNDNPVTIHFESVSDANEYIITSFRIDHDSSATRLKNRPLIIPEGQKCTMMFDVWALYTGNEKRISLSDIPNGKYYVFVELETLNPTVQIWNRLSQEQKQEIEESNWKDYIPVLEPILRSNTVTLEIIGPSEQETQFIKKMRKISGAVYKDGVNWSAVLRRNIQIDSNDITILTQVSREQMSLHKLISDVNITDEQSLAKSIGDIKNASIPNFFEPERQLLLFELKGNPAKEHEKFLKKYPELKWEIEKLDSGQSIFGIHKRITPPRRERTKRIIPPSEPNTNQNTINFPSSQPPN